jgi:heme/copper-type cytochrome/quinol oxidase subunit 1
MISIALIIGGLILFLGSWYGFIKYDKREKLFMELGKLGFWLFFIGLLLIF